MKLTIMERLTALALLPDKGNLAQMRLTQDLTGKLGLSADEWTEYGVTQEGDQVRWRMDIPQEKEIDLRPAEIVLLSDALKAADKEKQLTAQHISLYDKIVNEEE